MKEFSCGDVVSGCSASFRAATDEELMAQIARHAREDHGLKELTPELVSAVKAHVRSAPHG